jgi:mercuric ion binding protein
MKNFCFFFLLLCSIQVVTASNRAIQSTHLMRQYTTTLQNPNSKKTETIVIQTSAQCGTCKTIIEKALKNTPGVKKAKLDLDTKKVTVKYNSSKITPDQIRKAITAAGYDADQLPAKPAAYNALPACCKKGGHN